MALGRGHPGQSSPLGLGVPEKASGRSFDVNVKEESGPVEGGWEMKATHRGTAEGSGTSLCGGPSMWGKGLARG